MLLSPIPAVISGKSLVRVALSKKEAFRLFWRRFKESLPSFFFQFLTRVHIHKKYIISWLVPFSHGPIGCECSWTFSACKNTSNLVNICTSGWNRALNWKLTVARCRQTTNVMITSWFVACLVWPLPTFIMVQCTDFLRSKYSNYCSKDNRTIIAS